MRFSDKPVSDKRVVAVYTYDVVPLLMNACVILVASTVTMIPTITSQQQ